MHLRKWHRVGGLLLVFFLLSSSRDQLRAAETPAIADRFPGAEWERTSPEQAGLSAKGLADAQAWWATIEPTAAVMIVQHGRIVWEWGDTVTKSNLHSIRKSLLSALIGIAVNEHKIDLSATWRVSALTTMRQASPTRRGPRPSATC
jgi:CubicO group peptidase (beta-lactamase class C family)